MHYNVPIRVSVVGVGHMGTLHARKIKSMDGVRLVGVWDKDTARTAEVAAQFQTRAFASLDDAIGYSQAVILATPTETHGKIGLQIIERARHLLIEKPIASSEEEAEILMDLSIDHNIVLMVGHIENYNPALVAARNFIKKPLFIEAHRLTPFRGRGADVSVIEDLMVHDIELLVGFCRSGTSSIDASAASVLTKNPDIANARIGFKSGCVANITASRLSLSPKRKMRIFQKDGYISIDFEKHVLEIVRPVSENPVGEIVEMEGFKLEILRPEIPSADPLENELSNFFSAIMEERGSNVESAVTALRIVMKISEALE